ncbi:MAG: sigma 54-interacting transcriptional regulator [Desulfomonilaceae bacterium]|nr:sigma 54-interacting transcriptional regulator [Desulfomonilaceae bacterium]
MNAILSQLKLRVLSNISQVVGHALNLNETLAQILEVLSRELSMKRATITLKRRGSGVLAILASHGLTAGERERGIYRLDEGVTGRIFSSGKPCVVPDVSKEPLFLNRTGSREIDKDRITFIGVPITLHDETVGVLSVDRLFEEDVAFEEDFQFLTVLATLVAQLISLNDQVEAREKNLRRANLCLKQELSTKCTSFFKIGQSPAMVEVQKLIRKVAVTNATVLLLGESGTGKTLAAQIIHELSSRSSAPFIGINSAALPDNLLESELFGYEKGAFTGAVSSKIGRVEEAHGGTLFLDEIGEIPVTTQAKLLRFLQDREFERVGSNKARRVDVRIVAATNRSIEEAVREGSFREDLYYRLNVFPISVPPLRERIEDLEALVEFFSQKLSRRYGCSLRFTPASFQALKRYSWPGNVRELENLMERIAIMWEGEPVHVPDLLPFIGHALPKRTFRDDLGWEMPPPCGSLEEVERTRLLEALECNRWVQTRAAKELGISMRQIGYKIKKYNLGHLVRQRRGIQN